MRILCYFLFLVEENNQIEEEDFELETPQQNISKVRKSYRKSLLKNGPIAITPVNQERESEESKSSSSSSDDLDRLEGKNMDSRFYNLKFR